MHPEIPAVTAPSPGQAAYEAFWANREPVIGTAVAIPADWDSERPAIRDQWEAAAQAAIATAASHSAVYLTAIATLSAALHDIRDCTGTSTEAHHIARKALDDVDHIRPTAASASQRRRLDAQAAPELAAAMAETGRVIKAVRPVLDSFKRTSDGMRGRVSAVVLARAYAAAGGVPDHLEHVEGQ